VKYGIGVRYSEQGIRLLKVSFDDAGLKITGAGTGENPDQLATLFTSDDLTPDNTSIAISLGPGDFLSSYMLREDDMSGNDMEKHLKWQIEHKILSASEDYRLDYFITDLIGCVFAGRNDLIDKKKSIIHDIAQAGTPIVTDVESVALYNGNEGSGEIGPETVMLTSLEAEGISSLVLHEGSLVALETFTTDDDPQLRALPRLDRDALAGIDNTAVEKMIGHITDSMGRLSSYGDFKEKPALKKIVLSGAGAYIGNGTLAEMVTEKTDIPTMISNPLKPLLTELPEDHADLSEYSAAFTTCFGLALRALED